MRRHSSDELQPAKSGSTSVQFLRINLSLHPEFMPNRLIPAKARTMTPHPAIWTERAVPVAGTTARRTSIALICLLCGVGFAGVIRGADSPSGLAGEKTAWHGFDRDDFVMDEANLGLTPFKAADDEKDGVRHTLDGQRRCIVVLPKAAAPGNPGSWRGCDCDHQPQSEVELLKRGFHVACVEASATLRPGRQGDAWYAFLAESFQEARGPGDERRAVASRKP
jgi:hypothetical protein